MLNTVFVLRFFPAFRVESGALVVLPLFHSVRAGMNRMNQWIVPPYHILESAYL